MNKEKILIVEDDKPIASFISAILNANNYDAIVVLDGREAYPVITSHCPDLIILDLGLPDMDGLAIIKKVREWSTMPIVVVSARTFESDKVKALDLGADDYITKPFGTDELLARIRTALRHTRTGSSNDGVANYGIYKVGELSIDYDKRMVSLKGNDVHLTQIEYKIVALLGKSPGKVLTYDYVLKQIWGPHTSGGNQILRVNMANIRRKIEKNPAEPVYIFTEVGVGYRIAEDNQNSDLSY